MDKRLAKSENVTRIGGFLLQRHPSRPPVVRLSQHACRQMQRRGISRDAVILCLFVGRRIHARGARIHLIGRKELRQLSCRPGSTGKLDGLHVIVVEDTVVTVYRNPKSLQKHEGRTRRRPDTRS